MITNKRTLGLIQLSRGVACLLVILLHITVNYEEKFGKIYLFDIFKFGGSGVDIFFVLSGFIITYSNFNNFGNPVYVGKFIKRRIIRIFPIYWLIITALLLLQLTLPGFYKTTFVLNFENIARTYLLFPDHVMVNGVSWSLTNELFFYFLFAFALVLPNKKLSFYLLIIYCFVLVYLGIYFKVDFKNNSYGYLFLFPMNIEFILGVFIVLLIPYFPKYLIFPTLITGIVLFIVGAYLTNNNIELFHGSVNQVINRVVIFGLPAFLVILSLVKIELTAKISMHNLFINLGDASYSLYLIHLPIVAAFFKILAKLNIESTFILFVSSVCLFVGLCVLGIFIYNKIEKPLIHRLNKGLQK